MNYPFGNIDIIRKVVYPTTFLQSVSVKFSYDSSKETYESFKTWFEKVFNFNMDEDRYRLKQADALRLSANKGLFRLKISLDNIELLLSGESYHSFSNSITPYLNKFQQYFESISTDVNDIHVEKINIWPFIDPSIGIIKDFKIICDSLLSDKLLAILPLHTADKIASINFSDSVYGDILIVKYGIFSKTKSNPAQPLRLVLDTESTHIHKIAPSKLVDTATRLNDVLYKTYHWAVSEEVIEAMKKQQS